jgi:hypothetical protein
MEKLQQLTAYEQFADKAQLVDKYVFLKNINLLAEYDNSYKGMADKLNKLTNEYIEIEPNIPYNEFKHQLSSIYGCGNGISDLPLYNIICKYTHTSIQKYIDYDEIYRVIYKFYTENYDKFIELIKQVITPDGRKKWEIYIPKKIEEFTPDYNNIPKVPEVPALV